MIGFVSAHGEQTASEMIIYNFNLFKDLRNLVTKRKLNNFYLPDSL